MAVIVHQITEAKEKRRGEGKSGMWILAEWKADLTFGDRSVEKGVVCKMFFNGEPFPSCIVPGGTYTVDEAARDEYTNDKGNTFVSFKLSAKGGPRPYGKSAATAPATQGGPIPGYTSTGQQATAAANKTPRPTFVEAVRWIAEANMALGVDATPEQATSLFIAINRGDVQPPPSEAAQVVLDKLGGRVVEPDDDGEVPF